MTVRRRLLAAAALASAGIIAFLWMWTLDVHVNERGSDGGPAFCGSAYDVVLLKGNGFTGGEVPTKQRAIDSSCVRKAGWDLVIGGLVGVLGMSASAYVAIPMLNR